MRKTAPAALGVAFAAFAALSAAAPAASWPPVATFSILGYDPATGEVGGTVQSRVFAVGNGVLWAEADVGVVATQAIVDVSYGPQALALLRENRERRRDRGDDRQGQDADSHGTSSISLSRRCGARTGG